MTLHTYFDPAGSIFELIFKPFWLFSFEILNPSHVPSNGNTLAVTGGRGAGAGRHGAWPWRHRGTLLLGRSHWQGLRMGWGCCASTWSHMCGGCDHQSLVRGWRRIEGTYLKDENSSFARMITNYKSEIARFERK